MERILIAVDGSTGSERAVEQGLKLAQAAGASVLFLFVRQPPMPILDSPYYQRSVTGELEHAREALAEALRAAEACGVEAATEMLEGNPAHVILEHARICDVDLIVVGSRGLGAVGGALYGSVSQGVVHDADRPVMVVPPPQGAREPHVLVA